MLSLSAVCTPAEERKVREKRAEGEGDQQIKGKGGGEGREIKWGRERVGRGE